VLAHVEGGTTAPVRLSAGRGGAVAIATATVSRAARELTLIADRIANQGGTPLAVAQNDRLLGVIHLKDIVKGGIRERFAELRRAGIRTVMITGDNPLNAAGAGPAQFGKAVAYPAFDDVLQIDDRTEEHTADNQ